MCEENNAVLLKAEGITKSFPGNKALDRVTIDVCAGEVHALCGENGAGKSTLLKVLTGLYRMDEGIICIDGKRTEINSIADARRNGIYVIPQELQMVPDLSVAENIFIGKYPHNRIGLIDWKEIYNNATELIRRLGLKNLSFNAKTIVRSLSMGHKQLIEIMRALVEKNIRIMGFDEPTSSLSDEEIGYLFELIRGLKEKGIAIIYVSHRLEEIFRICDKVTVLKDGRYVDTRKLSDVTKDDVISMMVGRELNLFGKRKEASTIKDEVLLKVQGLTRASVYSNISFELKKGEILGLYGLVGSGRTEVMRAIFGIDKSDSGDIFIHGEHKKIRSPIVAIANKIGFISEDRRNEGIMLDLSVKWNFSMANFPLFTNRVGLLDLKKETKVFNEKIRRFSVKITSPESEAGQLSGGNQQKLIVAKWIATNCDILIFDEPTRGIDVGAKAEIYNVIKELAREGMGIIMVSSELPEILGLSDRILVFKKGSINAEMINDGLREEQVLKYAVSQEDERAV